MFEKNKSFVAFAPFQTTLDMAVSGNMSARYGWHRNNTDTQHYDEASAFPANIKG